MRRQAEELEFNAKCRMETTTHIQQMMANAQMPKPHIPLSQLTDNRIHMYTKRLTELRKVQQAESTDQNRAWLERKARN